MADKKITELTELTSASTDDMLVIVDSPASGAATKKITVGNLMLAMYPVGSIYISTSSTDPGGIFGGTWAAFGSGKTLVGIDTNQTEFNTVEKTGGEKTHQLTVAELASHGHYNDPGYNGAVIKWNGGSTYGYPSTSSYGSDSATTVSSWFKNAGSDAAHNNLQPYITTYMFKRTA